MLKMIDRQIYRSYTNKMIDIDKYIEAIQIK